MRLFSTQKYSAKQNCSLDSTLLVTNELPRMNVFMSVLKRHQSMAMDNHWHLSAYKTIFTSNVKNDTHIQAFWHTHRTTNKDFIDFQEGKGKIRFWCFLPLFSRYCILVYNAYRRHAAVSYCLNRGGFSWYPDRQHPKNYYSMYCHFLITIRNWW